MGPPKGIDYRWDRTVSYLTKFLVKTINPINLKNQNIPRFCALQYNSFTTVIVGFPIHFGTSVRTGLAGYCDFSSEISEPSTSQLSLPPRERALAMTFGGAKQANHSEWCTFGQAFLTSPESVR